MDLTFLNLTPENEEILKMLVETQEDLDYFLLNYWSGSVKQFFSIEEFRLYKILKSHMPFEEFKLIYQMDSVKALQKLFLLPMTQKDVEWLEKKVSEGKTTLMNLYVAHQRQPALVLHRLVY